MITVQKVKESSRKAASVNNAVDSELKTGNQVKKSQKIWPWILGLFVIGAVGYWLWKKGKQNNGEVPG